MRKYQSYKTSGIEWIREKPSNWISTKLKYVSTIITGNTPSKNNEDNYTDGKFLWIKPEGLNEFKPTNDCKEKISEIGLSETRIVPPYSVLINGIGNIGKFGYSELPVSTNQQIHSIVFDTQKVDKRYGLFLISSLKDEMNKNSEKVVVSIYTKSKLERLDFILPPLSEQEQIVKYLDEKTSIIDKLISTKERKIELLKEQRTSLINEVITKGLNPNVKMKDSGVEWIGDIPEHWDLKKVKYFLEDDGGIKIGPFGSSLKLDTLTDEGIKVYGQGNVIKDDFTLGHRHITFEKFESDFSQYEILEGDILITMMGTTGKSKVFKKDFKRGILDSHLLRLRFNKNCFVSELFVITLEQSDYVYHQLKQSSKGSIMEGLNSTIVKELKIITPPIIEQEQITGYLDKHTKEINDLVSMEQRKIELLKEYRQSLISEVITGKIKVVE
jgi:type I restriction enzyme S subunit